MKKLFLISAIAAAAMLTSCSKSNEEIARDTIEAYLEENLNDPSSYEFVKMDSISDEWINSIEETSEYITDSYDLQSKKETAEIYKSFDKAKYDELTKEAEELAARLEKQKKDFKPVHIGKFVNLKFRGKNALGVKILQEYRFKLSDDLKKVESAAEVE